MAVCKFNSKLDCRVTPKFGVSPCLICKLNGGQLALAVFFGG
jgi:hypothetical protein